MKRNSLMTIIAGSALLASAALAHAADYSVAPGDAPASQSDLLITANVKGKLQTDIPDVAPAIAVSTHDGVVTLKGVALTQDYLVKALFDARSVDGVVQVKDELSLQ